MMISKKSKIIIGSRGSKLALWQARWIRNLFLEKDPDLIVEIVIIRTKGDDILNIPLAKLDGKGLFIKEIEEALIDRKIDIAVHSMKDMPTEIPTGLCIGAIPEREDPRDVLICRKNFRFQKISKEPVIGTSSLRRMAQLLYLNPKTRVVPIRGNVGTRLSKIETQKLDAIVLAAAGMVRLGLEENISEYLEIGTMLPAVGQGALCVEIREDNYEFRDILASIHDSSTSCTVLAERSFLARLGGGCQVPIAANGVLENGHIVLVGLVASVDGSTVIKRKMTGSVNCPERIGNDLAELLLSLGAGDILMKV